MPAASLTWISEATPAEGISAIPARGQDTLGRGSGSQQGSPGTLGGSQGQGNTQGAQGQGNTQGAQGQGNTQGAQGQGNSQGAQGQSGLGSTDTDNRLGAQGSSQRRRNIQRQGRHKQRSHRNDMQRGSSPDALGTGNNTGSDKGNDR